MNAFFGVIDQIMHRKVAFLVTFFVVFTLSYGILYAFDFLPEPASSEIVEPVDEEEVDEAVSTTTNSVVTTPVSIPGGRADSRSDERRFLKFPRWLLRRWGSARYAPAPAGHGGNPSVHQAP